MTEVEEFLQAMFPEMTWQQIQMMREVATKMEQSDDRVVSEYGCILTNAAIDAERHWEDTQPVS